MSGRKRNPLPLKHRLMCLYALMLLPVFLLTLAFSQYAGWDAYQRQIERMCTQLENMESQFSMEILRIERIVFDLSKNLNSASEISARYPDLSSYRLGQLFMDLNQQVIRAAMGSDLIDIFEIYMPPIQRGSTSSVFYEYEYDQPFIDFYTGITDNGRKLALSRYNVYAVRREHSLSTPVYIANVAIAPAKLLDALSADEAICSAFVTADGAMIRVSGSDKVYSREEMTLPLGDGVAARWLNAFFSAKTQAQSGFFSYEDTLIFYHHTSDMSVYNVLPRDRIIYATRVYQQLLWLLLALTVTVLLITRKRLQIMINLPLERLMGAFAQVERGESPTMETDDMQGELTIAYHRFLMMLRQIHDLSESVLQKSVSLERAEYRLLQAQITPHFLNNSFNTLRQCILLGDLDTATQLTEYLSEYFRYFSYNLNQMPLLEDEYRHGCTYLKIQQIRYMYRLQVSVSPFIDEAKGARLPRLALQTLLENAVLYGRLGAAQGPVDTARSIRLDLSVRNDECVLTVRNEGSGLSPRALDELRQSLASNELPLESEHIGLRNVSLRLRMMSPSAFLTVDSQEGQWFSASIIVPLSRERSGEESKCEIL